MYAVALGLVALGGIVVPLIGGRSAAELEADPATERETRERAESKAATEQAGRERAEADAETERAQREAAEQELAADSQSQFELYEDSAEEWRWRLQSRNGKTLADSGEGYSSRRRAEGAVVRVKRHAPNAEGDSSI